MFCCVYSHSDKSPRTPSRQSKYSRPRLPDALFSLPAGISHYFPWVLHKPPQNARPLPAWAVALHRFSPSGQPDCTCGVSAPLTADSGRVSFQTLPLPSWSCAVQLNPEERQGGARGEWGAGPVKLKEERRKGNEWWWVVRSLWAAPQGAGTSCVWLR